MTGVFLSVPRYDWSAPLSHPSSCMLVNHGPSQQSSKEEYKPWKWGATARYYKSHGYGTNSLLSVINASTRLLLTTWLNSRESISQPANFAHLLILPVSVFPLYAYTRLVKGHFLMLHRLSGTLSLTKSGHPTPSHPSNHHLKPIFFSSPTDCVWGGGEGGRGKEREGTSGLSQNVTDFFSAYFISRNGLWRRNVTEKNTLLLLCFFQVWLYWNVDLVSSNSDTIWQNKM